MNTKLTISLNKEVIEQAKTYAKLHKVSLSSLIENYLMKVISDYKKQPSPKGSIVEELSGIIDLKDDHHSDEHTKYLQEKYQ